MSAGDRICIDYEISNEEYHLLEEQFGKLCWHAAHDLKRKNTLNNYTEDIDDIYQELMSAMLVAGSYTKRQRYIEKCLVLTKEYTSGFLLEIVNTLAELWENKTKHGASRSLFGQYQEKMLYRILKRSVPKTLHPEKNSPLQLDAKFINYAKFILWNRQKKLGKNITKEKTFRNNLVSISEFSHLGGR